MSLDGSSWKIKKLRARMFCSGGPILYHTRQVPISSTLPGAEYLVCWEKPNSPNPQTGISLRILRSIRESRVDNLKSGCRNPDAHPVTSHGTSQTLSAACGILLDVKMVYERQPVSRQKVRFKLQYNLHYRSFERNGMIFQSSIPAAMSLRHGQDFVSLVAHDMT